VGMQIQKGEFKREGSVEYTHAGSTGNLCLMEISKSFDNNIKEFHFEKVDNAIEKLLKK
ncbi:MAG: argininosuccinate lyase, partial [Prolixibacteraceae bacterium]|nr:argininosuccinate lyase [Prolixibacteraceae bacterium]